MRQRGSEESTAVEILRDDDAWSGATEVTTTRSRKRWPEALLAGAALAVLVGIGATSDSGDEATDMPRTTSTSVRRSTSTTRPRPSTTTTTWPAAIVGTGSVLGSGSAGTSSALVVTEQDGTLAVLDLDTGDLCRTNANGTGPWWTSMTQTLSSEVEINDEQGRSVLVGPGCAIRPSNRSFGGGWVLARTDTSVWTMEEGPLPVLTEHSPEGEALRRIPVPAYSGMATDGRWLVVSIAGELVAIDVREDRHVGLGSGWPMAAGGGRLLAVRCDELDCGLVSIDIESGSARRLDLPMPSQWEPAVLSPNGRFLSYSTMRGDWTIQDQAPLEPVVADLQTMTTVDARGGPCSFTADSRWLLCVRPSVIEAISLAEGRIVDLSDFFDRPTNGFAVLRTG